MLSKIAVKKADGRSISWALIDWAFSECGMDRWAYDFATTEIR